jgi:hypothetical protein
MKHTTPFTKRRWASLSLTAGLAVLLAAVLLLGLQSRSAARASVNTLYVNGDAGSDTTDCADPAAPCATIAYAIGQAHVGDEILVAQGIYSETTNIPISVTLKGGYVMSGTAWLPRSGRSVIDANGADDAVIWITPGAQVTIVGFAVQGANHTSDVGGGILIDRASAIISDTLIQNNTSPGGGAGIWLEQWEGSPAHLSLTNSALLSNTTEADGGGLKALGGATAVLHNVTVRGNRAATGGGVFASAVITIRNSLVLSNVATGSGGGIELGPDQTPTHLTLQNSIVADNRGQAHGGALSLAWASADLTNVLLYGNASVDGPASVLFANNSKINISNGTISDNNPEGHQAIIAQSSELTLTNSIVWNSSLSILTDPPCTDCVTVNYSDVQGECTWCADGAGNIEADPRFVDAADADYQLQIGSPCIDTGTSTGAPTYDLAGVLRDASPDMGAYEWMGFRVYLPLVVSGGGT